MKKSYLIILIILLHVSMIPGLNAQDDIFELISTGEVTKVKELIGQNPEIIDSTNQQGDSPLHVASYSGQHEIIVILIDAGSDINKLNPQNRTPLFYSSYGNHREAVLTLMEQGADPNLVDHYNISPLHTLCGHGDVELIEMFLQNGADINSYSEIFGTPLHRAVFGKKPEATKFLLNNGADHTLQNGTGTPLHTAAMIGDSLSARYLVEAGADVNLRNQKTETPLYYAIYVGNDPDGNISKRLINAGADINYKAQDGSNLLQIAAGKGNRNVVELLVEKGLDINVIDKNTFGSLLHDAGIKGFSDIALVLIEHGIDLTRTNKHGRNALDEAFYYDNTMVASVLQSAGLSPSITQSSSVPVNWWQHKMKQGEAWIWMMNNRGWVVKTRKHLFIIDNEEMGRMPDTPGLSNGYISTAEIRDQDIIALYSAYHARSEENLFIHAKEDSLKNITFIHYKDDGYRGGKNSLYLKGHEIQKINGVEIIPIETHLQYGMGSLGYVVNADGVVFYYSCFLPEEKEQYFNEMDYLDSLGIDCDFVIHYIIPGKENEYLLYAIEKLTPEVVFPMDNNRKYEYFDEAEHKLHWKYPGIVVGRAKNPGDRFYYSEGKLQLVL